MRTPRKTTLFAGGLAALLALGLAAPALARDPGPAIVEANIEAHHGPRHPVLMITLRQIVQASGVDASEFREGFAAGKSINDVLVANGVHPATVVDALLADFAKRLDHLVQAGELARERADAILARARERLEAFLAGVHQPGRLHRPIVRLVAARTILESAAKTIGLSVRELIAELIASKGTIASVAEAHAVDPQDVIDDAVQKTNEVIAQAEEIGRITSERARQLRDEVIERVTEFVNEGPGAGPLHRGGPFERGRGR